MSKSRLLSYSKEQIQFFVKESNYYFEVLSKLGYKQINDKRTIERLKDYCSKNNIDLTHLSGDIVKDGKKVCNRCLQEKSIDDFYQSKGKIMCYCKQCHRELEKNRYNKKMEELNNFKKTLSCKKCGEKRFYLLDFHHKDKEKKDYAISENPRAGLEILKKEIEKCDVLCSNCHREWHYLEHTTDITYEQWINQ